MSSTVSSSSWSANSHAGWPHSWVALPGDPAPKRLRSLPATPEGHHSYAGGLLEHTVAVATLCRDAAELHRRLRRDLLLSAALLHDIGRTRS